MRSPRHLSASERDVNTILAYADFDQPFILHADASSNGLGVLLHQRQNGKKRVIAFASRGLRNSKRHHIAHKLRFIVLKLAVNSKFHDYLYGNKFDGVTDKNPLTYILTTEKLDATGHRWLAALPVTTSFQSTTGNVYKQR